VTLDKNSAPVSMEISEAQSEVVQGRERLRFSRESSLEVVLNANKNIAYLDGSKVTFPIRWRTWHAGDFFSPLGMTAHKKISDFLIDLKVPVTDKEDVTVLESQGEIVWVVGFRISEKAKVTSATQQILRIDWRSDLSA
jgi:tRNA(Ile)-lysidine synthase